MKSTALVLTFFISLFATAAILSRVIPPAYVPQFSEKIAEFSARKDEFDTLFFGSSRTFRQILPTHFDPVMAAAGRPTHSFNFGLDGMFAPEDAYVFEKIAALRPKNLRRVFVEISAFNVEFAAQPENTRRALHWHDPYRTVLVLHDLLFREGAKKLRDPVRWQRAGKHARLCWRRGLNVGDATRFFDGWRGVPPPKPEWALGHHGDGAVPYESEAALAGESRATFDRDFVVLRGGRAGIRPLSKASLRSMRGMLTQIRELGAEPILFIAPAVVTRVNTPANQLDEPLLDFSDPNRWPALFDLAHRYDRGHLNAPGARLFSRIFAEEFLKQTGSRP